MLSDPTQSEIKLKLQLKNIHIDIEDLKKFLGEKFIILPLHFRCIAHSTSRICESDFPKALENTPISGIFQKLVAKCNKIWNSQSSSTVKADFIKDKLSCYLKTPAATRWNSLFDSLNHIFKIISEQKENFEVVCKHLSIEEFTDKESEFLSDYLAVFKHITSFLDVMQGESEIYAGCIIPMLKVLMRKLNKAAVENENRNIFSQLLLEAIAKR